MENRKYWSERKITFVTIKSNEIFVYGANPVL